MAIINNVSKNLGIKKNSSYDGRKTYNQRELDAYRISEGYSKEKEKNKEQKERIPFDKKR